MAARATLALTAALLLAPASPLSGQTLRYSGSVGYSGGNYFFEETTHSVFLNSGLSLEIGRFDFSLNLPLVFQSTGLVSFVGGIPVPTGGENSGMVGERQPGSTMGNGGNGQGGTGKDILDPGLLVSPPSLATSSGLDPAPANRAVAASDSLEMSFENSYSASLGDPLVQGSVDLYRGLGSLRSVGVRVGVKAPLAGLDSGVGTGEWDAGAGASLVLGSGATLLLADLGYWWYGDLPDLELRDGFSYSGALSRSFLGYRASLMLSVMGAQPMVSTAEPPLSAGIGLGYIFSSGRMMNAGFNFGLSESSPGLSLTLGWSVGG